MTERIDHAAEARRLASLADAAYGQIDPRNGDMAVAQMVENQTLAIQAQVHATLALVEQQRIANLIIVAGWVMDSTVGDVGHDLDKLRVGVAGEVWEGLGLA